MEAQRARRRFDRERTWRAWMEWCSQEVTRQALVPMAALLVLAMAGGWWLGSQQGCRGAIVDPGVSALPAAD
jgi:hypothetical protein